MTDKREEKPSLDIYSLLLDASRKQKKAKRQELLKSVGVEEFFEEGSIRIDMRTCEGVECKICIKLCPTNALYWKTGEIGVVEELCIYCTSCVLNCMVDNCIEVRRKRQNGGNERFSKPSEVLTLNQGVNTRKRMDAIKMILPDDEAYLNRYRRPKVEY